jgi:hypothetical protein
MIRRQFIALFKKFAFTPEESGFDPEAAALATFEKAERRCARVNLKFRLLSTERYSHRDRHFEALEVARKYILRVLGDEPDLSEIYSKCDFGGGASVGVHGDATNLGRKLLADSWSCTPSALPYAIAALWSNDQIALLFSEKSEAGIACLDYGAFELFVRARTEQGEVQHNKISFVPKTAKTHRTIAVEPMLNGFLQKGVDQVIRSRLKDRRRIDLSDQGVNQKRAYLGSLDICDPYATLDLSAASDSISIEVVRRLLPPAWFRFLDRLRSPAYELNGVVRRYNKFCSMGNGFCFPLETLIFAALCHAAYVMCRQRPDVVVYGDDIIVRQNIALYVIELLKHCGFTINTDKSFVFGPFRESCGADWLRGQDITPVYMRKRVDSLTALINLHNSLYTNVGKRARVFPELCYALKVLAPERIRYPELFRPTIRPYNTGFLCELDEFMASPHSRWDASTQSWSARGLWSRPVRDVIEHPLRNGVEYLAVLRGSSAENPLSLRRKTKAHVMYDRRASLNDQAVQAERRSFGRRT